MIKPEIVSDSDYSKVLLLIQDTGEKVDRVNLYNITTHSFKHIGDPKLYDAADFVDQLNFEEASKRFNLDEWEKVVVISGSALGKYYPEVKIDRNEFYHFYIIHRGHLPYNKLHKEEKRLDTERNAYAKPVIMSSKAKQFKDFYRDLQ